MPLFFHNALYLAGIQQLFVGSNLHNCYDLGRQQMTYMVSEDPKMSPESYL